MTNKEALTNAGSEPVKKIKEILTPEQKQDAENWGKAAENGTLHFSEKKPFPNNEARIVFKEHDLKPEELGKLTFYELCIGRNGHTDRKIAEILGIGPGKKCSVKTKMQVYKGLIYEAVSEANK